MPEEKSLKERIEAELEALEESREVVENILGAVKLIIDLDTGRHDSEALAGAQRSAKHILNVAATLVTQPGRSRQLRRAAERGLLSAQLESIQAITSQLVNPSSRFREYLRGKAGAGATYVAGYLEENAAVGAAESAEKRTFSGDVLTLSAALSQTWDVIHGGQDVWAAVGSRLAERTAAALDDQLGHLDRLTRGLRQLIRTLERPRYDPYWALLLRNRRVALALMRLARANLHRTIRFLDEYQGFDRGRYRQALGQLLGAQGALANTPEGEQARAWLIDFVKDWNELDSFRGAIDKAEDRSHRQRDALQADWEALVDSLEADWEATEGRGLLQRLEALEESQDFFDDDTGLLNTELGGLEVAFTGLADIADLRAALAAFRDSHRQTFRRISAFLRASAELEAARQDLGPIREDLIGLVGLIEVLALDMEAVEGRLELMASMPGWVARLGLMRGAMDAHLGPEVQAALAGGAQLAVFATEYLDAVAVLSELDLFQASTPPADTQKDGPGEQLFHLVERLLSGQSQDATAPDQAVHALRNWLRQLHRVRGQLVRARSAVGRIPQTSHPAVTELERLIEAHTPYLDGLQWIMDSGHWSWAASLNAGIATQAGLLAHRARLLFFNTLKLPRAHELLQDVLNWLEDQNQRLLQEQAALDTEGQLQAASLEHEGQEANRLSAALDQLADILDDEVELKQVELQAVRAEADLI